MRDELQNKLFEAGPILYSLRNLPITECLMCWGICCPDEWFDDLLALTEKLEVYNKKHLDSPIHARQVKIKFGQLCFYINDSNNKWVQNVIEEYELKLSPDGSVSGME